MLTAIVLVVSILEGGSLPLWTLFVADVIGWNEGALFAVILEDNAGQCTPDLSTAQDYAYLPFIL